jgi:hypothetical protein
MTARWFGWPVNVGGQVQSKAATQISTRMDISRSSSRSRADSSDLPSRRHRSPDGRAPGAARSASSRPCTTWTATAGPGLMGGSGSHLCGRAEGGPRLPRVVSLISGTLAVGDVTGDARRNLRDRDQSRHLHGSPPTAPCSQAGRRRPGLSTPHLDRRSHADGTRGARRRLQLRELHADLRLSRRWQ